MKTEHQALGEQLRDQAAAAGAQSGPHGQFPAARGALGQQQIGDIGARDQQDQRDRAEGHGDRRCRPAPTSKRARGSTTMARFAIVDGLGLRQRGVDGLHSFAGLSQA